MRAFLTLSCDWASKRKNYGLISIFVVTATYFQMEYEIYCLKFSE